MVKLTQIEDESNSNFEKTTNFPKGSASYSESDDSDSESEVDDDFDIENETLLERITALKDIIPPQRRSQILSYVESSRQLLTSGFQKTGSLLWILTSSALLLGVPLSMAILSETQLQEMEKEISLQKSAQDVLAPGSENAFAGEKPAEA